MNERILPPVVHVIGWSGRGKTLLMERLLPRLSARGIRVATAKHAHGGYELDREDSDSSRHAAAGSLATALVGPSGWAVMHHAPAPSLHAVLDAIAGPGVGLVLVEGFTEQARHAIVLAGGRQPPPPGPGDQRILLEVHPQELSDEQLERLVTFCAELAQP